jgi:hypothetical protein
MKHRILVVDDDLQFRKFLGRWLRDRRTRGRPRRGSRKGFIDTVEICGSSPHGPTIIFNTLERFLRNPTETSPVILHL